MKKALFAIIIAVAIIGVVIGATPATYERVKASIESVKTSSYNLTADIATITIACFAISDFAGHVDKIELEFYQRVDNLNNLTGESGWVYRSWEQTENDPTGTHIEYVRQEIIVVTPKGWTSGEPITGYSDYYFQCMKAAAPVADLINFDRSEEAEWGFFEKVFNEIRLGVLVIQTVISAVVVTAVDTISLVWSFASAGFQLVGLSS